jgi:hypothetical protein
MRGTFPARAEEVFIQLCPSREADWIPGWDCELVFTESGYAEEDCIFRTDETSVSGPGVWVISHHEPPRLLEIVRFVPSMVIKLRAVLSETPDRTTEGLWTIVLTGLDQEGNALIEQIPKDAYDGLLPMLARYLETGEMPEAPLYADHHAHRFGKAHEAIANRLMSRLRR